MKFNCSVQKGFTHGHSQNQLNLSNNDAQMMSWINLLMDKHSNAQ